MSDMDQSLEKLLSEASPRPVPAAADTAAVRDAVRAEWQLVSGRHKSRQRMLRFAVAASVLLGVFAVLNTLRVPAAHEERVASIQRSFGSIYVLGEQSQLTPVADLKTIQSGQTIITGADAGIALAWSRGGSVRLDKNTRVEFRDDDTLYLKAGQVYFDSTPSELVAGISAGSIAAFEVETDYGRVTHVGTQFMTAVASGELKVSVREGQVEVAGRYHEYQAAKGEQVRFVGSQQPVVTRFSEYGSAWDWVGATSPPINVDGKSAHEFLLWAGRELGRDVVYTNAAVEQELKNATLRGDIDLAPADALKMRMATADIAWRVEEGTIYVGESE
ncbi:MAG: FecR family protein [Gammaproteobacteria bacterium]|nr:FecR family protein [Gammaproteobacteria bacterium]MDH5262728.1 FecR family protein [Gammaproteobacteria bacterium]